MSEPRPASLRIGLVIERLIRGAGTEEQVRLLVRQLTGRGFEFDLCLTGTEPPEPEVPPLASPPLILGVRRILSPAGWRGLRRFRSWVASRQPHLLLSFWRDADLICALGSGAVPVAAGRRNIGAGLHRPGERWRARWVNRGIDRWVANSRAAAANTVAVEHVPPSRVTVLPNLLDTDRFRPPEPGEVASARAVHGWPRDAVVFGCVANLRPVKRHADLIEAFRLVHGELPATRLLLAGTGPLEANLRNQARSLGDAVRFVGSSTDTRATYAGCDVAVLASRTEGFPNALLEAAACGLPLITTDSGGAAELVCDAGAGDVVPVGDVEALAAAMIAAAQDSGRRARVAAAGRAYSVARHGLGVSVPAWERFLREAAVTPGTER